jgi:hypothetical protein
MVIAGFEDIQEILFGDAPRVPHTERFKHLKTTTVLTLYRCREESKTVLCRKRFCFHAFIVVA